MLRPTATPGQLGVPCGSLSLANRRKFFKPCGRMRPRLTQGDSSPRALCAAMHPQQRQKKRPRWCMSEWEQCTGWPLTKTVTPGTTSLANAPLLNLRPTTLANPPHPDPSQAKTQAELREPSTPEKHSEQLTPSSDTTTLCCELRRGTNHFHFAALWVGREGRGPTVGFRGNDNT